MSKPLVLLVGGAGNTGRVIAKSLLKEDKFRVAILAREQSINKPIYQELKDAGAEIRIGDISESPEKIEAFLQGVEVLFSLVVAMVDQKPLFQAAKKVGVGRVIPSDFGPTAPRGVMAMHDLKLDIREYIKDLGLPHTFIEVGWWPYVLFPYPHSTPDNPFIHKNYVGDRQQKVLVSTLDSIGVFTARIIADPRTLNQVVVIHDWELTLADTWALAAEVSGEDFSDYPRIPDEEVKRDTQSDNLVDKIMAQYSNSVLLRGDNVLSAALARGALDARVLYPDVPLPDLREEAKKFYANPPIPDYDISQMAL